MKLLKVALEQQNYDLAARVLVYGLLKTMVKELEEKNLCSSEAKQRRTKRQPERPQARLLQPGS
jgi:hypothetical protein